jgi:hypothetical protein
LANSCQSGFFIYYMFKRLLLLSAAALLCYRSQAQSTSPETEITLPGQGLLSATPSANKRAVVAAQRSTVSQLQELLIQNWNGSAWADFSRQVYLRYSAPTLPGTIRTDRKSGGAWAQFFAHNYRYNTAGQTLSDTTVQYQQAPFGAYTASLFTFNTPTQVRWEWLKFQDPLDASAPWDSLKRSSHTYNAAGQRTQVLEEMYSGGAFSALTRQLWSYNAQGQVSVYETQTDGTTGTNWEPLQRLTYTYNAAGKLHQVITETAFMSTTYSNTARNTVTYDARGRETLLTTESWDNNAWVRMSQTTYDYTASGDLATATAQVWNSNTAAYQNQQRIVLGYSQVALTNTRAGFQASSKLTVAPNPGSGPDAVVHYALAAPATASVEVFDLAGRRVGVARAAATQGAGEHAVSLAGLTLAPGLYQVRLRAGEQHAQVKWDKR